MSRATPRRVEIDVHDSRIVAAIDRYWRSNLVIMAVLLAVWAAVGLGCGVLLADSLNQFRLGGFPLGFWFAQQGAILTFVLLILIYALALNRLDDRHHRELEELRLAGPPGTPATAGRALQKSAGPTSGEKRTPQKSARRTDDGDASV